MRFERRYEGIHYAITLRPSKTDGKLKTLRELEIEIYRKSPEGHIHGYTWKISFFDRELKVERREYSDFSWRKMEVSIRADDLEAWWIDEVEETIRDLGVKDAAEHFLKHLRLIFDHPLAIPLRL
jgi:hypothetical protein